MRELVVQGGSDTLDTTDLAAIDAELTELKSEITSISANTEFNGIKLLNGDLTAKKIQVGANSAQSLTIATVASMDAATLVVNGVAAGSGTFDANIALLDTAITTVSTSRSTLGAQQNRLEHTIANLNNGAENLQSAESRIRDVDMAKEMMEYTKNNILQQASQSMLAQANQAPQGVLQLLS
jgi:flagellin